MIEKKLESSEFTNYTYLLRMTDDLFRPLGLLLDATKTDPNLKDLSDYVRHQKNTIEDFVLNRKMRFLEERGE